MKYILSCYRPQRSWGKVMFLQASVILLTGRGSTWHTPQTRYTPWSRHPPRDQVPPTGTRYPPGPGTPPGTRYIPRDQVHPWPGTLPGPGTPPRTRYTPRDQVRPPRTRYTHPVPPGPGTPPNAEHAGRYGQWAGGMHPTWMQSCIWNKIPNVCRDF